MSLRAAIDGKSIGLLGQIHPTVASRFELPQNVWLDIVNNPFIDFITYEDIFILENRNFIQAVAHATGFAEENYIGLELGLVEGGFAFFQFLRQMGAFIGQLLRPYHHGGTFGFDGPQRFAFVVQF